MLAKVLSGAILGIDAYIVEVEVDIAQGLPVFATVGLPDGAVKESKERVKSAIKNSGYDFPPKRITVNLAPADVKKEGGDCTIVAAGRPLHFALAAAEELEKEGIHCEVIDPRTYRPLDLATILTSVRKTNYCVIVDQSWPFTSVASEIAMTTGTIMFAEAVLLVVMIAGHIAVSLYLGYGWIFL